MDMQKTDTQSHVTDCSDMMATFISKEGANSYPTSVVLLNRFFMSIDEYQWRENSGITADLPTFKIGDDVHWYKLTDMYNNLKNAVISESLFKNVAVFKEVSIPTPTQSDVAFKTKNRFYIYNSQSSQIFWSNDLNPDGLEHENSSNITVTDVLDMLSVGSNDFLLCKNAIYRIGPDNSFAKVVDAPSGVTFNAFDASDSKIVVASTNGAYVYTSLTETTLVLARNVVYETVRKEKIVESESSDSGGSSSSSSSSDSGNTTTTITVDVPNGIPKNNNCIFAWISGSTMYVGDTTTSCNLPVDGPYNYEPSESHIDNPSMNPGKHVSSGNKHYDGINGIAVSGVSLDGSSTTPISTSSGFEYDGKVYNVSNVKSMTKTSNLCYVLVGNTIKVFLLSDTKKQLTQFNTSNKLTDSKFICLKDRDLWVLGNDKKWYRSYNPKDNDITFGFILFAFNFEANASDDKVDCRLANVTLDEILSLSYSRAVYDKYFAKAMSGTTTFLVSFSKTTGSKSIFNLMGNDNRRAKAVEMKKCCNAFDIGDE